MDKILASEEMIELSRRYSRGEGLEPTSIPELQISYSTAPTSPIHTVYRPCFCLILQGEKDVTLESKTYSYGPEQYLVSSIDLPVTGQVTRASKKLPYLCLVIEIKPETVYEILAQNPSLVSSSHSKAIYTERVTTELLDASLRLLRTLKNDADREILSAGVLREITYRLLSSPYSETIRQLGIAGSQMQRISKVIDHLNRNYAKLLRMEDLARIAHMSASGFHQHFKSITQMSPLQYQKRIRLQEARRMLSTETADASSVAFKVGYESASQFSREYTRMFGRPPMSDMKFQRKSVKTKVRTL
ncbi:MAG: AraC family transcriptional regulator [Proteobacteria bacterium]|nr:MAG: AraC family transcriptional regulator [Pseudomonadota bacterium]